MNYKSDIKIGEKYRDTQTGFEGHATALSFFQHGCERVTLKGMNTQCEIVEYAFDAAEVESVKTGLRAVSERTGGPHDRAPMRRR
jgi:hypothetical protein